MSSSRRGGGEINILAMLDGQSGRPRKARKLAWIGAGALLACALAGGLVWLVRAPSGGFDDHRIAADLPDPKPAAAAPAPLPISRHEPPPYVEERPPQGAAIVDQPLHQAADVFPAEMLPDAMKAHGSTPTATAHPAAVPTRTAATKPPAHAAAPRSATTRTAAAAPSQEAPVRAKRTAAAAKPAQAPAAVDTDVALISAIIQHVNQRGELQDNAKSSTKRMPTQP